MTPHDNLHEVVNTERLGKVPPVLFCVPPPRLGSPEPETLPILLGRTSAKRHLSCDVKSESCDSSPRRPSVRFDSQISLPAVSAPVPHKGHLDYVQRLALIISGHCDEILPFQSVAVNFLQAELKKAEKQHKLFSDIPSIELPKLHPQKLPRRSFLKKETTSQSNRRCSAPPSHASKNSLDKVRISAFVEALEKTQQRIDVGSHKMMDNTWQLQVSARSAAQRLRSTLHCSPHRPFDLPAPMRMQPVVERARKRQLRLPPARSESPAGAASAPEELSPCRMQKRTGVIAASHDSVGDDSVQSVSSCGALTLDPLRVIQMSSASRGGAASKCSMSETEDDDDSTQNDDDSGTTSRCMSRMDGSAGSISPVPDKPLPRLLLQVRKEKDTIDTALEALERKSELSKCGRRATMTTNNAASDFRRRLSSILEISEQVVDERAVAMQSQVQARRVSLLMRRSSTLGLDSGVRRLSNFRRSSTCPVIDSDDDDTLSICEDAPVNYTITVNSRLCDLKPDDDSPEPPSRLRLVQLRSSCGERMKRLRKLTTLHSLKCWSSREELGMTEMDRARFAAVFTRYDASRAGCLGLTEVHYALEDLGLRIGCQQSKEELFLTLQAYEGGTLDFRQFCEVVAKQRKNIFEAQRFTLKELFHKYDKDESGMLQPEDIMELVKETDLCPVRADEKIAFCDAVLEFGIDAEGGFDWDAFEELAQLLREKLAHCRYEREHRIFYQTKLPFSFFLNFRHQLTRLHEAFHRFDTAGLGYLQLEDCQSLILDLGFSRSRLNISQRFEEDLELHKLASAETTINFATMLRVLQRVRDLRVKGAQNLKGLFDRYDMCRTGLLKISEIVRLFTKLEFDVALDERIDLLQMIEDEDIDGDGSLNCDDFLRVYHSLYELCLRRCRDEERTHAESLGFSNVEFVQLCDGFHVLESPTSFGLDLDGLVRALKMLGESWASEDNLYDSVGPQCSIDLKGFLNVCHAVNNLGSKLENSRRALVLEAVRKFRPCNDWTDWS